MKKSLLKFLQILFIILGITFLSVGGYLYWQSVDPNRLAFSDYKYSESEAKEIKEKNLPTHIEIPDVNINLQVIPAEIKGKNWDTTTEGISYLTESPVPGNEGNSIMYGHNRASLLGRLPQVKPGNTIIVEYADKTTKKFSVAYTLEVSPGDSSILEASNDKRLTIYTCTGILDSKRFVAVAFLSEM